MKNDLIRILHENARLSNKEIAERLGTSEKKVVGMIAELEKQSVIKGYQAIIDEAILPESAVKAVIEVKVKPEREGGFDRIARRLSRFPEVFSLSLVSGSYDLELEVQGKTLQDVAAFVSNKLATTEGVISTNTSFILKKYKVSGRNLDNGDDYERLKVTP